MAEVLETKNGVNKFVMQKELERQTKMIEEQKKVSEMFADRLVKHLSRLS